jgi:hypothetical protein
VPARLSEDQLVLLSVRVWKSTRDSLRAIAAEGGVSLSDAFRAHLTLTAEKPLGQPIPRRRPPRKLGSVSRSDPELLRQVAAICGNLNQIARAVNTGAVAGTAVQAIELLVLLLSIERQIGVLASPAPEESGAEDAP